MTRPLLLVLSLFTLVHLTSCEKDKDEEDPPAVEPPAMAAMTAYSNLETGNYWVYQKYKVDSADAILETMTMDSIWVAGDSVMADGEYALVYRAQPGNPGTVPRYWRDSLTYLVTATHEVLFCTDPLDEVIYSLYQGPVGVILDYSVHSTSESITVPAGTFTSHMMRAEITSIGGYPEQPDWKRLRSYWAEGVGRVRYYEFFGVATYGIRYDLVRYHVE